MSRQIFRAEFAQSQSRLLGKSFVVSGLGFLLVAAIAALVSYFISINGLFNSKGFYLGGSLLLVVGIVCYIIWNFKRNPLEASWTFIIFTYSTYIIGFGVGFGLIFSQFNGTQLAFLFGSTGALILFSGLVGRFGKEKFMNSLGKLVGILSMFFLLVSTVTILIMLLTPSLSKQTPWWMILITIVGTFLSVCYIAFDVYIIRKKQEFLDAHGADINMNKAVAFFGFRLLSDFLYVFTKMAYWARLVS